MPPPSGEKQHPLGRRPRGREGERLVADADVPEDPTRDERIGDRRDAVTTAAAAGAAQDVVGERPLEELGPGAPVGGRGGQGASWVGARIRPGASVRRRAGSRGRCGRYRRCSSRRRQRRGRRRLGPLQRHLPPTRAWPPPRAPCLQADANRGRRMRSIDRLAARFRLLVHRLPYPDRPPPRCRGSGTTPLKCFVITCSSEAPRELDFVPCAPGRQGWLPEEEMTADHRAGRQTRELTGSWPVRAPIRLNHRWQAPATAGPASSTRRSYIGGRGEFAASGAGGVAAPSAP